MVDLRGISFGSPAAIVTSMALVVGLDAATVTRAAVVGGLLVVGVADNLTDSLSVHIYQEAEQLAQRQAFRATVANFCARFVVSSSFVPLVALLPPAISIPACVAWGFLLLCGLSYLLARARGAAVLPEMGKHAAVAVLVIVISRALGLLVRAVLGGP